jgi:uncharacterized repeat protein (TIGR03803 family)
MLFNFRARTFHLYASAWAVLALGSSSAFAAPIVRFKTLHEFHGADGVASIAGPLVKGADGLLYGVLPVGGEHNNGVLFSITRRGDFKLLHSFSGGLDGSQPNTLFRDPSGNIYGATAFGGLDPSYGVLFSVGADGRPTVVHNFSGFDGGQIGGSIVQYKQGSFYGTTGAGGMGTVYRFTPPSTVETLYEFRNGADQAGPYFGLSKAAGMFYGTTYSDLQYPGSPTYGTVFRVTDTGELTVLYTFTGGADGKRPVGPPVRAADGNFYGVTSEGGEFGCGTIYRIDATGAFSLVHAFTGDWNAADGGGCTPFAALVKGKDGRLYGSTYGGGNEYGLGLIFRVSVSGELEVLHKFQDPNESGNVMFPLIEGRAGSFFGMTIGSLGNTGTVFKLVVRETE